MIGLERLPPPSGATESEWRLRVPAQHAFLEGHFPGNPVLPAAAQLLLVHELACERAGERLALLGLSGVRLRRRIAPGEELALALEDSGRFELRAAGELATSGALELARATELESRPPESLRLSEVPHATPASNATPSVAEASHHAAARANERSPRTRCLPHALPALLLGDVLEHDEHALASRLELAPDSAWRIHARGARLSGLLALEAGAQAAALHLGLALERTGEPRAQAGFLVALRAARFDPAGIELAPELLARTLVRARCVESAAPLSNWSFELEQAGRVLASGRFSAWQSEPTS